MNFINNMELARRLKNGQVLSREKFHYFIITEMLTTFVCTSWLSNHLHDTINQWDVVLDIITTLVTLCGIILIYRTNSKGDDKEFIERIVCLSVPIYVQVMLLIIILSVLHLFFISYDGELSQISTNFEILIVCLYFYLQLNWSIKVASH